MGSRGRGWKGGVLAGVVGLRAAAGSGGVGVLTFTQLSLLEPASCRACEVLRELVELGWGAQVHPCPLCPGGSPGHPEGSSWLLDSRGCWGVWGLRGCPSAMWGSALSVLVSPGTSSQGLVEELGTVAGHDKGRFGERNLCCLLEPWGTVGWAEVLWGAARCQGEGTKVLCSGVVHGGQPRGWDGESTARLQGWGERALGQPGWRRHRERNDPFVFPSRQRSLGSFKLHVVLQSDITC